MRTNHHRWNRDARKPCDELVPWKRDPLPKSRSAAPGWQGATTEKYWAYSREAQRRQPGCPAREFGDGTRFQGTRPMCRTRPDSLRRSPRWILIGVFLLTLAAAGRAHAGVVRKGPASCGGVALTFDLCPVAHGGGYDEALVHLLVDHHIHATFFPSGRWIDHHDAAMRQLLAIPYFEIGTH